MIQVIKDILNLLIDNIEKYNVSTNSYYNEHYVHFTMYNTFYYICYGTTNVIRYGINSKNNSSIGTNMNIKDFSELEKAELILLFNRIHEKCKECTNNSFAEFLVKETGINKTNSNE